jgi:glycerol-3-phosphate dehydrogenase (NAD(P)+)
MTKKVSIIGAGSWGTAIAAHVARIHDGVVIWDVNTELLEQMKETGFNQRYLPGVALPSRLDVVLAFDEALKDADIVLLVVPSHAFRTVVQKIKPHITADTNIVWATKGLDPETQQLLHTVVEQELGEKTKMAVISGPSFAKEVANVQPTIIDVASNCEALTESLMLLFNHDGFRLHENHDFVAVQLAAALKNIVAIAVGMADGLQYGSDTTSALITIGLRDIYRLGGALGAKPDSFLSFSGVGDLVLTCGDNKSRNRRFGLALGHGEPADVALENIGQVVEGLQNTELALALAKQHQVELNIAKHLQQLLDGEINALEAIRKMLAHVDA